MIHLIMSVLHNLRHSSNLLCSDMNVILQVKIWRLPVDVSHDSVCNPSTTLCIGDRAVELVLWNPVAENVLASATQQSIKIYDLEQQTARIGNFFRCIKQMMISLYPGAQFTAES